MFSTVSVAFRQLLVWEEYSIGDTIRLLRFLIEPTRLVSLMKINDMELRHVYGANRTFAVLIPTIRGEQWLFERWRLEECL